MLGRRGLSLGQFGESRQRVNGGVEATCKISMGEQCYIPKKTKETKTINKYPGRSSRCKTMLNDLFTPYANDAIDPFSPRA